MMNECAPLNLKNIEMDEYGLYHFECTDVVDGRRLVESGHKFIGKVLYGGGQFWYVQTDGETLVPLKISYGCLMVANYDFYYFGDRSVTKHKFVITNLSIGPVATFNNAAAFPRIGVFDGELFVQWRPPMTTFEFESLGALAGNLALTTKVELLSTMKCSLYSSEWSLGPEAEDNILVDIGLIFPDSVTRRYANNIHTTALFDPSN